MPNLKEPLYFASKSIPDRLFGINIPVVRDETDYLRLYKDGKGEAAIGDGSASYLWNKESPKLIHDKIPDARIIMILRDPVERAFSHYLMHLRDGSETILSFYEALKIDYLNELTKGPYSSHLYVGYGLYSKQVTRYLKIFGKEQIKILVFEEFVQSIKDAMRDILEFLGIPDSVDLPDNLARTYNSFLVPRFKYFPHIVNFLACLRNRTRKLGVNTDLRILQPLSNPRKNSVTRKFLFNDSHKPKLPANARLFLEKIYYDDVIKLQSILGRTLPWPFMSKYEME